jgi:hypothetical protein
MERSIYPELRGLLALCALLIGGCADEEPRPDCPARAAFEIVVRAADGPLPRQTAITVGHNGGTEAFRLDSGDQGEVVFCDAVYAGDGGNDDVVAIACDLWTRSLTSVEVKAPGYPPLERELQLETEDGCIETQSVELLLDSGDGSPAGS